MDDGIVRLFILEMLMDANNHTSIASFLFELSLYQLEEVH